MGGRLQHVAFQDALALSPGSGPRPACQPETGPDFAVIWPETPVFVGLDESSPIPFVNMGDALCAPPGRTRRKP
jgi:hypothetical protein